MKNSLKLAFLAIFSLILAVFSANAQTSNKVQKTFYWSCNNQDYTLTAYLTNGIDFMYPTSQASEADYYAQISANSNNYNVKLVTQKLVAIGRANGLNNDQQAELTITFFQSFPFVVIKGALIKFSDRTLIDGNGTCDDLSLAAYQSLKIQGYSVALISYPDYIDERTGEKLPGHLAIGLGCPKKFAFDASDGTGVAYVELTRKLPIGTVPKTLIGKQYTIILHEIGPKMYSFSKEQKSSH